MTQVKVGVVGVGRMGRNHCRVLNTIRSTNLIGVYDTDRDRASAVAREYETVSFNTFDELLDSADALIIATPTQTHHPYAVRSLEAGLHILIEKPLASDLKEGEEIESLVEKNDLIVQVGHIERFNPAYRELKNLIKPIQVLAIDSRRLSAYESSNTDIDVVFDLLVHDIDLIMDLIGKEPKDVDAIGLQAVTGGIDHIVAHFCYDGGPLVTMTASRVTEEKIRKIEVTALEAFIETDLMDKRVSIKRRTMGEYANHSFEGIKYRQESLLESIHVPMHEPLLLQAQHFIACIRGEEQCIVPADDGLRAMRLGAMVREKANDQLMSISLGTTPALSKMAAKINS